MKHSQSVDIQAAPEAVFPWLEDSQRVMRWIEGVVENEDLEVTEERVGSTFRQVFDEKGRRMEFQGVVTAYERNRRVRVSMVGELFDLEVDYRLEPLGDGTHLTQNSDVRFKGAWRLLGPVMGPMMKKAGVKKLEEDFARLKKLCEGA